MAAPPTPRPGRRLRADKREAIVVAARAVFARLGYSRASTEQIAREAEVSTRTLYRHFPSKDELFRSVLVEGAEQVSDMFLARASAIDTSANAETVLLDAGRALADHRLGHPEHFAMFQQVTTEREHFPAGVFDDWQRIGPQRVEREVSRLLTELSRSGEVDIGDVPEAAFQLILLTAGAIGYRAPPGTRLSAAETERMVARGVQTFLHGYAA